MSSSLPLGGQKRSISSSIVEFFTKPAESRITNNVEDKIGARGLHNKRTSYDVFDDQNVDNVTSGTDEHADFPSSEPQGSLIIYETDSNVRPPLLPILPIQRLRLLRQKQEWRRQKNSNMLFSLSSQVPSMGEPATLKLYTANLLNPDTSSYSYPSSSTPSPIKQGPVTTKNNVANEKSVHIRMMKRKKIAEGAKRGTKWSGEFEYDLSEYDNEEMRKKEPTASQIDSPTLSMAKRSTAGSIIDQDINSDALSATQKNILLNGPESFLGKKGQRSENKIAATLPKDTAGSPSNFMGVKRDRGSVKDSDKAILPSVGFDFIKDNDTPSKKSSPQKLNVSYDKQATSVPVNDNGSLAAVKPLKSFSLAKSNEDNTNSKHSKSLFNFKPVNSDTKTSASSPPSFSFGNNVNNAKQTEKPSSFSKPDQNTEPASAFNKQSRSHKEESDEDHDEPKRKRPEHAKEGEGDKFALIAGTPSIQQGSTKVPFSFGGGTQEANDKRPSLALEDKEKETSGAAAIKPSFTFGVKGDKSSEHALGSTDTNKTTAPAGLAFGGSQKKENIAKPSFTFGNKDTDDKTVKPMFSLDGQNSTAKPKFTFAATKDDGDLSVPKLSSVPTDTKETSDQISKPSFSFSNGNVADGKTKPTFSFGTTHDNTTTSSKETSAVSSSVAAGNSDASKSESASRPSAFSFNRISSADNEATKPTSPFSLDKKEAAPQTGFSFGNNAPAGNGTVAISNGPAVQNSNVNGAYSFNKSGLQAGVANAWAGPASSNSTSNGSFNFKFGETNSGTKLNAPSPQPAVSGSNPFIGASKETNGFSFGAANSKPNGASVFNSSQPTFGGGTTPSPSFGKSATPPVLAGSNAPSRAFSPSSTVNLNFGNTATADPSSIFSGGMAQPAAGAPAPQYIFGNTPPPSQIFGGAPQQPTPFDNGMSSGEQTQPSAVSNFQMPAGRKLARMRRRG